MLALILVLPLVAQAQPPVSEEVVIAAFEAGDPEAIAAIHTEDGVVLAPGEPPIKTRTALETYYEQAAELGVPAVRNLEVDEVIELGEFAYVRGSYAAVREQEATRIRFTAMMRFVAGRRHNSTAW